MNPLALLFSQFRTMNDESVSLELRSDSSDQVAAIIPDSGRPHSILVQYAPNRTQPILKNVSCLHSWYDSLVYVLLFPYGNFGWSIHTTSTSTHENISAADFYK